ncbi:hypothetical protein COW36_13230 [bacterium (Candidatus Blackallbacteria) CG17_big_fil_post_rev_8_21_14_2_50_48_46]|uniref:HTH tetR-type domain-containing protein n=1 Tax=bacterium (Candidatus Blackallbacteria) CG17_big_fil_post_rev_8_21_14_2_50_48_46 TaxID=2014261 RepID=A0A2M7G4A2_9BACT|nr:MAG: hypothetical protein COW64_02040 [bacterium (Candidatus Blackallbacteria) CG18_big_fil_WC_8_21_14_2_50_49_26]PIW16722.1 MAG: hypothetical protein COW36_13230 [bacterium (Candidatus Blackallbacteria) CG17_big_fil_post_rev_8_21_14_2_50_48_46]PIW46228.1 MAG: hypothetical protein COW20_18480 [bacterium (Candidatus Blackallbacteria) CG13_big_fil_rev_8_21_14_2_50_49_14]
MAREPKPYDARLNQILDTALVLFMQNGYEDTSIQTIIDTVEIAKGTFYHYFKSKEALLEKLIDRESEAVLAPVYAIVSRQDLNALEKLNQLFLAAGLKKVEKKETMLLMARAIYSDSNLRFREKWKQKSIALIQPAYETIIAQGLAEQCFDTLMPHAVAELICSLHLNLSDALMPYFLNDENRAENRAIIQEKLQAFEYAVARILGVAVDSIQIFDRRILELFLSEEKETQP